MCSLEPRILEPFFDQPAHRQVPILLPGPLRMRTHAPGPCAHRTPPTDVADEIRQTRAGLEAMTS